MSLPHYHRGHWAPEVDARRLIRKLVIAGLAGVSLLACSGVLTGMIFNQYSVAKWAVTVMAPLSIFVLMLTDRAVGYLAAAVVAALPFLPLSVSFQRVPFSPVVVLITLAVAVAFLATPTSPPLREHRRGLSIRGAAVLGALLLLPAGLRGTDPGLWLQQVAIVAAVGYLVMRAIDLDEQAAELIAAALAGSVAFQGLLAIGQFRTGHAFNPYGGGIASRDEEYFFAYLGAFRPSGSFFDPISLGNVLALACPVLVCLACDRGRSAYLRVWCATCSIAVAAALVLTLSRMSWVAAAVGIAVVIALSPAGDRLRQAVLLVGTTAVVSASATLAGPRLLQRFASIFDPTGTGVATAEGDEFRQQLWRASLDVFSANPLVGVGSGNLPALLVQNVSGAGPFGHAHSTYLQNLAESGLLGAGFIAMIGYAALTELRRRRNVNGRTDVYARACAGSLAAIGVVWLTDYTVRYTAVLACMGIPFILLESTGRRRAVTSGPGTGFVTNHVVGTPEQVAGR